MTSKVNVTALGLVTISALILGGCSGSQYSSTTTEKGTNPNYTANKGEYGTSQTTTENKTATNNFGQTNNNAGTNTALNEKKNQTYELSLLQSDKQAKLGQEVNLKAKADPGTK